MPKEKKKKLIFLSNEQTDRSFKYMHRSKTNMQTKIQGKEKITDLTSDCKPNIAIQHPNANPNRKENQEYHEQTATERDE